MTITERNLGREKAMAEMLGQKDEKKEKPQKRKKEKRSASALFYNMYQEEQAENQANNEIFKKVIRKRIKQLEEGQQEKRILKDVLQLFDDLKTARTFKLNRMQDLLKANLIRINNQTRFKVTDRELLNKSFD